MGLNRSHGHIFWRLERGDTLSGVTQKVFKLKDARAIALKSKEILQLNPQIQNPNRIMAGSVLSLGAVDALQAGRVNPREIREIEQLLGGPANGNAGLVDNWMLYHGLSKFEDASCRVPVGVTPQQLKQSLGPRVAATTTSSAFAFSSRDGYKVSKSLTKTVGQAAKGKLGALKNSTQIWQSLEGEVVRGFREELRYVKKGNLLKIIPPESRAYNLGGKAIIVNAEAGEGLGAFAKKVRLADKVSKVADGAGKVFKVIDLGLYINDVYDAYGTPDQNRSISKATAKYGAGLLLGTGATVFAGKACVLLTFTTGVGGGLCFFTLLLATSYGISKVGEKTGEALYDTYEVLYDSPTPHSIFSGE